MLNILNSIPNLIIGNKNNINKFCLNFLKKTYNINSISIDLNNLNLIYFFYFNSNGEFYKKQDLEKLNNILSLNYNDIPITILIEDAHLLPKNLIQNFLKIFEEIPPQIYVLLTTNSITSILESIKSRCSIIILEDNQIDQENKYQKSINYILELSEKFNFNSVEDFIKNNQYTEFEIKELCEEFLIHFLNKNDFEKSELIKNILKQPILPSMQKNILRMIFMIITNK